MSMNQTPKRSKFFLFFGLVWLFFAAIFIYMGMLMVKSEQRFASEGVTVSGQLTDKTMEERHERDRETHRTTTTKSYYAHYNFTTKEGQSIKARDSVDSATWEKLKQGAPIDIQYIPGDPAQNRVARESSILGGVLIGCFGGLAALVGIGSLVFDIKQRLLASRLMQSGMLTEATVTRVGPGSVSINGVSQWQIEYTYRDLQGGSHQGKTPHMSPNLADVWRQGDKGKVRFDQNKPSKHIWIGKGATL